MIKQLTIICSAELSEVVGKVLTKSGAPGFARFDGTGTNILEKSSLYRDLTWPSCVYIVPAEEEKLRWIIDKLKAHAGKCSAEPCMKLILTAVEEFY